MRFLLPLLVVLPLSGCLPSPPPKAQTRVETKSSLPATVVTRPPPAPTAALPASPGFSPRIHGLEISGISFEGVEFDARRNRLAVIDQPNGPGSEFPDAASAARSVGGIAAVNAGFFTPEGAPLGLVIQDGRKAGVWNSASSLGSGLWSENSAGILAIQRRGVLGRSNASGMHELIQAGPMLIENGRAVSGLDSVKSSARTLILWDGGHHWWIGRGSACSLASLAQALATGSPTGWPVRQALNLDGGRSADLWVSGKISGGPLTRRAPWNRPVRNFLVLVSR